jgi:hypothetical protein
MLARYASGYAKRNTCSTDPKKLPAVTNPENYPWPNQIELLFHAQRPEMAKEESHLVMSMDPDLYHRLEVSQALER